MDYVDDSITIDADVCNGKPTIRGTRITVETIIDYLSNGDTVEDILVQYPSLAREDINAYLKFAASVMKNNYELTQIE